MFFRTPTTWELVRDLKVYSFDRMRNEVNFFHIDTTPEDRELVMGPFTPDDGPFLLFNDSHTLAHLLHMAGCYESVNQARKYGWSASVKKGYSQIRLGKNHSRMMIYILNKWEEE